MLQSWLDIAWATKIQINIVIVSFYFSFTGFSVLLNVCQQFLLIFYLVNSDCEVLRKFVSHQKGTLDLVKGRRRRRRGGTDNRLDVYISDSEYQLFSG